MHNITKLNSKIPLAIHHTFHKTNTINPYTRPCAKTIPLNLQKSSRPIPYHATIETNPICKSGVVTELPTFYNCQICCHGFVATILLSRFCRRDYSAIDLLSHFFFHDFADMVLLSRFFFHEFSLSIIPTQITFHKWIFNMLKYHVHKILFLSYLCFSKQLPLGVIF